MNKINKVFTLLVVALVGLSLAGCSEDNLDTNPYSKSGVNIVGFGPSPILRTHEIRITGTSLGSVSEVVFAGKVPVERSAFNKADDQNIYVNVPDASLAGKIRLVVGTDTVATSVTPLTFEEPIEITSVSPTEGLSAGDEVTVKGDYLYNIYQAIFTSGVTGAAVEAEDFTYVSRREIRFRVPLAAESGVITFTDGADWEEDYKDPVTINTASVSGITASADFGQQIQITGSNLHTVESVIFPGGVSAEFNVSADHKTITATVPAECKSGAVSLLLYSGAALSTGEFAVPTVTIDSAEPNKDLIEGDVVVLTGEHFDRVTGVTLPGYGDLDAADYNNDGTISITDVSTLINYLIANN